MADELPVRAGWALWGKEPGTRTDYAVLACSPEPFSRADFGTIITRFAAGTPDTSTTGAGKLPWVTVSWVGVDVSLHLGICVTASTGQVDAVGRPITQTSYYCVPYQAVARAGISYSALYDAVRNAPLIPRDGDLIPLTLTVTGTEEAAQRFEDLGERLVGAAAAELLRGPVSIVEAENTSLKQRLDFIDAVASLLPFGYRAKLSAATWSDSGTRHRLRLAFASRPRDDAAVVSWRHTGEISGGDAIARAYYERLRELRSGTAAHGKKFDLTTVVADLLTQTEPQKFEQSQEALDILSEIDLPNRVLQAFRDGAPLEPAQVRQAIRVSLLEQMPSGDCQDLLAALSMVGSAGDWPGLSQRLGQVTDLGALFRILSQFGRRVLWTAQPDTNVLREVQEAARTRGLDDDVLAELAALPERAPPPSDGVLCAAGLLAAALPASGTDGEAYPVTRDALAKSPPAVAAYLAALAGSGGAAGQFLTWLAPQLPPQLALQFGIALGSSPGGVTERDFAELVRSDPGCVSGLLATGSATRQLDHLLPGFTFWAASCGELSPPERRYWSERLGGLVTAGPAQRAWLDLGLLSMGASPTALPPPAGQPDSEPYITGLASLWKRLQRQSPQFSAERCVQAWASYLGRQEWADRKAQAASVVDLAGRLLGYDPSHRLAGEVGSRLTAVPAAKRWDFAQDWLARVRSNDPEAVRSGLLVNLETVQPGTGPGPIAGLCLRAQQEGISAEEACRQLAKSGAINSAELAVNTVFSLEQEFERSGVEPGRAAEWLTLLTRRLARGAFRETSGPDFRDLMSHYLRQDIRSKMMLFIGLAEGEREGQYELTDKERDDLSEFRQAFDYIGKRSRKSPSLWRRVDAVGQRDQALG